MSKTIKFLYAITLFLFLFLIEKNNGVLIDCKHVRDCPKGIWRSCRYKCIDNKCVFTYWPH
ncbi:Nodule Cysteine-Rich (NCR) secreted peptide [Medicago truncatula]|uniref:Nodule Cysteine-Rich (NCR) secreted peptide n=2 Tax=Medicago truncatula TaxID=3880 RepID=G7J0L4_MEDTR|nr:Nodule Cysteine-Rich (NCR) secreted peptide [Medicago truncatula]